MQIERTTQLTAEKYKCELMGLALAVEKKLDDSPHWMNTEGVAMDVTANHWLITEDKYHIDVRQLAHSDPKHESRKEGRDLAAEAWECLRRDVMHVIESSDSEETEGSDDE